LFALAALGCLLLGALLWLLWPSSESTPVQAESPDSPETDVAQAMAAERAKEQHRGRGKGKKDKKKKDPEEEDD
jgi:hypothetical protein